MEPILLIGHQVAYPIQFTPVSGFKNELKEISIPPNSPADGKTIVELNLPQEFLIILIARSNEFLMPNGGFTLSAGDTLIVLSGRETFAAVETWLNTSHIL